MLMGVWNYKSSREIQVYRSHIYTAKTEFGNCYHLFYRIVPPPPEEILVYNNSEVDLVTMEKLWHVLLF